jgi:hypothetical protein
MNRTLIVALTVDALSWLAFIVSTAASGQCLRIASKQAVAS